jgi:proteasome lid subunit RPN8/RPN11
MVAHCAKGSGLGLACCGILGGKAPLASAIYPLRNAAESPNRYEAHPRDLLQAAVDLRKRRLEMVAIYQFRPKAAPVPSPTDLRENNYGDLPRVIVSLGETPTIRVWRLARRYCEELPWRIRPRGEESAPEDPEGALKGPFVRSILGRLFRWRRSPLRIPIGRLPDFTTLVPEPMWDRALDRPRDE